MMYESRKKVAGFFYMKTNRRIQSFNIYSKLRFFKCFQLFDSFYVIYADSFKIY